MGLRANSVRLQRAGRIGMALAAIPFLAVTADPASAAGCNFEPQGEGRVSGIIDPLSFRLQDGREVRLAGIEPAAQRTTAARVLAEIIADREISLRGEDDTPDRYGRQPAIAFLPSSPTSVQEELLSRGEALVSSTVTEKECASALMAAEAAARRARRGFWAESSAIKNTESPGDILAGIGRFMLVEGKVLSVRQAGTTTYLNFGQNWTRDFAATISRRALAVFEAAGILPKSLENRRIRVRGFVEAHGGPRIELVRVGQIEVLGGN